MRKRIIEPAEERPPADGAWLNLKRLARAEISSEDVDFPLESALGPDGKGWRAAHGGEQVIRFLFDQPQRIRRIRLVFEEERQHRTHEFSLAWAGEAGGTPREIVRQQYNFTPPQNTREVEDYAVELAGVKILELRLRPDIGGGDVCASLGLVQVA